MPCRFGFSKGARFWGHRLGSSDPAQAVIVDTTGHTLTRVALPPVQARVASAGLNITLGSAVTSIDSVTTSSIPPLQGNGNVGSDVILLKDQTTASENGLYYVKHGQRRSMEPSLPSRC